VTDDRDITLRLDLEAVPPVAAAPGVIDQVLDNLIANAIDAAPAGSVITLPAHRVDDMVELHVTDQGPGMTQMQRCRAFDRFWRAGTTDGRGESASRASTPCRPRGSLYAVSHAAPWRRAARSPPTTPTSTRS
jgi:signal transduction histidine kinase